VASERQGRLVAHLLEREAGADLLHLLHRRELLEDEALQRRHVGHRDADQVVRIARHQITLHHLIARGDLGLEGFECGTGLLLQADRDEDVQVQAEALRVEQRDVLADQSAGLQRLHAREAGRGRQADTARQFDIGQAGVGLQFAQDAQVGGVEVHRAAYRWICSRLCRRRD
jgi:hypothetical protein